MKVLYATAGNSARQRELEKQLNGDLPIRSLALVAQQHARMVLEMTIMERVPLYISSPLGGKDKAIRYALTIQTVNRGTIPTFLKTLIKHECQYTFEKNNISIERIAFKQHKVGIILLIPAITNPYECIEELIDNIMVVEKLWSPIFL